MSRDQRIHDILQKNLTPSKLDIINNSHQHAGHSSSPGTGESHYHIIISSQEFQSKSRVEIHRMINKLLKEEFDQGLHALSIEASH